MSGWRRAAAAALGVWLIGHWLTLHSTPLGSSRVVLLIHSTALRANRSVEYSPAYCGADSQFSWKSSLMEPGSWSAWE